MPVNKDYYTLAGSSGQSTGYTIDQSIRFARTDNSTGGSCMHRTPSGAGNRKKWTFSFWFKLGYMNNFAQGSGHYYGIFSVDAATNDANRAIFSIASPSGGSDFFRMQFQGHGTIFMLTTREFRDPTAWYHCVLVWDTAQDVPNERQALYINGQRETAFQTFTNPTDEQEIGMNLASRTLIGASRNISSSQDIYRWDGYMADIHFLDGYAYGPEYFGEFESNNIWIPKEYTGSYGSNGYKIDGRDASDLGDDESGNGNDFTTINHAAHDQMIDTPTNNFSVMNPLDNYWYGTTFAEGNLEVTTPNSSSHYTYNTSTILVSSGKWYVEFFVTYLDSNLIGVTGRATEASTQILGFRNESVGYYGPNGKYYKNNSETSYGNSYAQNNIIGVALDLDNNKLYFSKNGTFQNSGDPTSGSTGTGAISIPASSATFDGGYRFACGDFSNNNNAHNINFGQDGTFAGRTTAGGNSDGNGIGDFKYSVPSGYLAMCTKNLGS